MVERKVVCNVLYETKWALVTGSCDWYGDKDVNHTCNYGSDRIVAARQQQHGQDDPRLVVVANKPSSASIPFPMQPFYLE